jgi:hypothetical protein
MTLFGKRRRRTLITRDQAFDARPVAVRTLGREPLPRGGERLTIELQPRGMQKWLLRVPEGVSRNVELDAIGIEVFDMCDGKTSVRQITRRFAKQYKVDPQEAEIAVTTFIRQMMRKGLVSMMVEK